MRVLPCFSQCVYTVYFNQYEKAYSDSFDFFTSEAYHLITATANYTLNIESEMRESKLPIWDFLGRTGNKSLCNLIPEFSLVNGEDITMKHVKHNNLKQFQVTKFSKV